MTYLLMYTAMLLRCLVVDGNRSSRMIKIVGPILLLIRFSGNSIHFMLIRSWLGLSNSKGCQLVSFDSVWPFELATYEAAFRDASIGTPQNASSGDATECPIAWGNGVLILNLIADALASGFLGGMFIQR